MMRTKALKIMLLLVVFVAVLIPTEGLKKIPKIFEKRQDLDILVTSLKLCPKADTSYVSEINYELVNGTGRLNGTLLKTVKSLTKIVASITVCRSHCEHFQTWQWSDGCPMLNQKNMFWSPFFQNVHPPLRCPVKPGFYKADAAEIDKRLLLSLPFARVRSQYRVQLDVYEGGTKVTCFDVIVNFDAP